MSPMVTAPKCTGLQALRTLSIAITVGWVWSDNMIHCCFGLTLPHRPRAMQDDIFKASRHTLQATPVSITGTSSPSATLAISNRGSASPAPAPHPYGVPFPDAGNSPELFETQQGEAPPPQSQQPLPAPGSQPPGGGKDVTQRTVQPLPAAVAIVHTPEDLQAAIIDQKRDIEIRSHLDLRVLAPENTTFRSVSYRYNSGTNLAFMSWPTRSIRGNCTFGPYTGPESAELEQLFGALTSERVPLKPFQCLLVTDTNTLFLDQGHGFWLDNLYVGVTQPRIQADAVFAKILSTTPWNDTYHEFKQPMNIFLTNITLHGHGLDHYSARLVSITPPHFPASLLFQDSIFVDLSGKDPPFLIASRAYATFYNCLFRNVNLPRSEIFDVSMGGTVKLLQCHFSDIFTKNGLVDTMYNDYIEEPEYEYEYDLFKEEEKYSTVYGQDDHGAYDIDLNPAPEAAATAYGTQYVVVNETISDCLFHKLWEWRHALPGCPEETVAERRKRATKLVPHYVKIDSDYEEEAPTDSDEYGGSWGRPREDQEKRELGYYDQYYSGYFFWEIDGIAPFPDYNSWAYLDPAPSSEFKGSDYSLPPSEGAPMDSENSESQLGAQTDDYDLVSQNGIQLSTTHPWFRAIVEVLPTRPPVPPSGAPAFRNGLPLCTACGAGAPVSPQPYHGANAAQAPDSNAGSGSLPHAVLICIPAACVLCLLALAGGALLYRRRRMQPGDGAGEEVRRSSCDGAGSSNRAAPAATAAEAGQGPTAGLHAISMHRSLTEDLRHLAMSQGDKSVDTAVTVPGQHGLPHHLLGPALNPQYEYKLPRGLGLAMNGSTKSTEIVGETVFHTANKSSADTGYDVTFIPPSELFYTLQHSTQDLEVQMRSGSSQSESHLFSNWSWSYVHTGTSQSTQAPCLGAGMLGASTTDIAYGKMRRVVRQLNIFTRQNLLLGRFELLGPHHRRQGGQALVQFAVDPRNGRDFAVKFFLQEEAFEVEAALYAACLPSLRAHLSSTLVSRLANQEVRPPPSHKLQQIGSAPDAALSSSAASLSEDADDGHVKDDTKGDAQHPGNCTCEEHVSTVETVPGPAISQQHACDRMTRGTPPDGTVDTVMHTGDKAWRCANALRRIPDVAAKFLPQVEVVCDDAVDPRGRPLPPCIIMEKGESLQDWSNRAEPDCFISLAVLSNVASRLAVMHEAGYVHRDLKPANVMWLPRENRWTVIDFGCVASIGEIAPLSFTLAYACPEVIKAHETGTACLEVTAAMDAWSLGVMAYELLTGAPAFKFLTEGRAKVVARLKGELSLPWEEALSPLVVRQLGVFKRPVLQLLQRHPSDRISTRVFHELCGKAFSAQSAHATVSAEIKHISY